MGKHLARAGLTGAIAGVLVLGLGGRLVMRLIVHLMHQDPHFGIVPSLGILLIGGIMGTLAGVVYGLIPQRRWPGHSTLKALIYGSLLFGVLVLAKPAASEVAAARAYWWAIIPLFWAICVGYALGLTRGLSANKAASVIRG
jgi:ABC-type antimicrobial peptide transport system permease subunit